MYFGLLQKDIDYIKETIKSFPEIERAIIFGSRSMGNYKRGSDIDLAIDGKQVDQSIVSRLSVLLNEDLPLPYYFDVVDLRKLQHEGLKEHIEKFGKVFYEQ